MTDTDVVVVGAGADGPALAWRLGKLGLDVLVLEAGPWHGHEAWPNPHDERGATASDDPDALSGELMDEQFTRLETDTNDPTAGTLRVGPANRERAPWFRDIPQNAFLWQVSGVGGTSLHYFANHPRAYPTAFEDQPHWPIDYGDLVPYYQLGEEKLGVHPAPTTTKEAVYYYGAEAAGYDLIDQANVTETGYRPQPNAITPPDEKLRNPEYDGPYTYPEVKGDTLTTDELHGTATPLNAPVKEKAKKSSNVGWVPRALETGNVTVRPNAFVTDVTTIEGSGTLEATGVDYRDTWTGSEQHVSADAVVLAAGCIETPRLWLNADLPNDGWVGRGLTTHWFDWIVGFFDGDTVESITREAAGQTQRTIDPFVGQNSAARFDKPGVGGFEVTGNPPGLISFANFLFSRAGFDFDNEVDPDAPWDSRGRIAGPELKRKMADYRQSLSFITLTDDRPHRDNGVRLDPVFADEHGPVPLVEWTPHEEDTERREELSRIGAEIMKSAGADHVHRADWPPLLLHMQSTMRMGKVLDASGEAKNVDRLYVADHSALANGLGGPNPTNTGQALALRTADKLAERYFDTSAGVP